MPSLLKLVARAFRRDITGRHFLVIGAAIVIAVAGVTAVDLFTDRVRTALDRQSSALLAADAIAIGNDPLPPAYAEFADSLDLATTTTTAMRSVVSAGDTLQLVELKAVGDAYPLRGELLTAAASNRTPNIAASAPAPGTVWVEARLLPLIDAQIGDELRVGAASLAITRILVLEPDRGGDLFNIAPRVMMHEADLDATGLIAPGSRVRYSLLVAGVRDAVTAFEQGLELRTGDRLLTPRDARPEVRTALARAERFLGLATFTTVILAGIAIALAARSFSEGHHDTVALLRTFGASRRYVFAYFALELLLLGACMALVGAVLGAAGQAIIAQAMSGWMQGTLPSPSPGAAIRAAAIAIVALTGFALPSLLQLRDIPPARVLRSDQPPPEGNVFRTFVYATVTVAVIFPWDGGEWVLTAWSLAGLVVGAVALVLTALLAIRMIGHARRLGGFATRFGIANIVRRGTLSIVQITALGLGILALLVLAIVRNDLLEDWIASLPPDAPNQFLINIQPEEVDGVRDFFAAHGVAAPAFHPMVRARLVAINDAARSPEFYGDPRARRLAEREFNLSAADTMKPYNQLVAGTWWQGSSAGQFSVERDIATTLGIQVGDTLTYRIADQEIRGTVKNLRAVRWDSMQVNFFVEAPPALLADYPATYITSFRLNDTDRGLMRELVQRYPSVTVIDVAALVDHLRMIMARSATTVEFVFLFTLAAGVLVLVSAVQATQGQRVFESAILKTLGASRLLTLRAMSAEFFLIGSLAGIVAGVVSQGAAYLLARHVLEIDYSFDPTILAAGAAIGITGVTVVGSFAILDALGRPAALVLRYRQ